MNSVEHVPLTWFGKRFVDSGPHVAVAEMPDGDHMTFTVECELPCQWKITGSDSRLGRFETRLYGVNEAHAEAKIQLFADISAASICDECGFRRHHKMSCSGGDRGLAQLEAIREVRDAVTAAFFTPLDG